MGRMGVTRRAGEVVSLEETPMALVQETCVEGFTETEVALVLGRAVGTVESRLDRARGALRQKPADDSTRDRPWTANTSRPTCTTS